MTSTPSSQLLPTRAAARHLGVSPGTIQNWRVTGFGPAYMKLGKAVRYRLADLDAWTSENKRYSTADHTLRMCRGK